MFNPWFAAAAAVAFFAAFLHFIFGGRDVARPLLRGTELDPVVRDTNYYCWHMVTIVLFGMAIALALATFGRSSADLSAATVVLAAAFTIWSIGLVIYRKHRVTDLPQWILFFPIAALGAMGLSSNLTITHVESSCGGKGFNASAVHPFDLSVGPEV